MKLDDWLRDMKMKRSTYFRLVAVTIVMFGVVIPMLMSVMLSSVVPSPYIYILYVVPYFGILVIVLIPNLSSSKRKMSVERNMPMFVTQMAALSTSDMSFDRVFYILSEKKEYGQLAEDAKVVYRLLRHYSVGAAEACRFVALRTKSTMESEFFNRLSHSMDCRGEVGPLHEERA